jgi:hypothetical protein
MHRPIGMEQGEGTHLEHSVNVLQENVQGLDEPGKMKAISDALQATTAEMRQLIKRLRDSIPSYADTVYVMNIGDTQAKLEALYSSNIIRCTAMVINTPTASTAVNLALGIRNLPLPSGLITLAPISFIHKPDDPVTLTVVPALTVPAFIWIMGQQLPEVDF